LREKSRIGSGSNETCMVLLEGVNWLKKISATVRPRNMSDDNSTFKFSAPKLRLIFESSLKLNTASNWNWLGVSVGWLVTFWRIGADFPMSISPISIELP
jgi:hypothetical protein